MKTYFFLLAITCLIITITDIYKRKIDNRIITFLFVLQVFASLFLSEIYWLSFLKVISIGVAIYCLGFIAAGDVKLAAVLSLGINHEHLASSILIMVLLGGGQSIYYIVKHVIKIKTTGKSDVREQGVPYGVAICGGFCFGIVLTLIS